MAYPSPDAGHAGASPYGNFHEYYSFNPIDERLGHLPDPFPVTTACKDGDEKKKERQQHGDGVSYLDIGCNEGDLTIAMVARLPGRVALAVGVDIDDVLIGRAREKTNAVEFVCGSVMEATVQEQLTALARTLTGRARYSLITFFSVTMWVHIHHGDDGLRTFLDWVSRSCNALLVEPQAWKSYKRCRRRWRKLKADGYGVSWEDLKIRQGVDAFVVAYLQKQCAFEVVREFEETKWGRRLVWMRRATTAQEEEEHREEE